MPNGAEFKRNGFAQWGWIDEMVSLQVFDHPG